MKQNLRFIFMTLLCAVFSTAWGQTSEVLFHETFGDNPNSARTWSDEYSEKSGVEAVYSGITGYIVSNVKQGKNTTGSEGSGLNQSTSGTDAYIILGPLDVSNYYSLGLFYQWKAGSTKGTYYTKAYYATSETEEYSELQGSAAGETSFVPCTFSLPPTAQVSTLYLKIVFNTSNTQAIIDEIELTGLPTSSTTVTAPTFTPASGVVDLGTEVTIAAAEGLSLYYTTDGTDPTASNTVIDAEGNTATVTINSTTTIKAVAMDGDANFSNVVSAEYKIVVAAPTFDPEGGAYTETQNVTISAAEGCTISYTTDGSDPLESNTAVTSDGNTATVEVSSSMTIKAVAMDSQANFSEVATANYTIDNSIATLPFSFDGGSSGVSSTDGLIASGLGSDYNSSPKLKFDSTGDYLVLHFDERPGNLSFNIKGNSFSGGTFKVQTSEDGETFTDLETYTDLESNSTPVLFDNLGESVRYIKWIYTEKVLGNVALGNIILAKFEEQVEPEKYAVTITFNDYAEIFVFKSDDQANPLTSGDEVPAGSSILVSVDVNEGYQVEGITVSQDNDQNVPVTAEEDGISWTFTMPESPVTIAATVSEVVTPPAPTPSDYIYAKVTSADDLTDGVYLIVYEDGNVAFNGSLQTLDAASNTVDVTITDNQIKGNNIIDAATFEINATNGTIKSASGLYIGRTDDTNGLETGEDVLTNEFSFDADGNAVIQANGGAYLRYNNASNQLRFRYYKSSSYTNQKAIQLYKKLDSYDFTINPLATDGTDCYATISNLGDGNWIVPDGVTASTVVVDNNGQLTYPFEAAAGDIIPGNGAYLLKGTAGNHSFAKSSSTDEISIGSNMLYPTGEGNFLTVGPDNGSYFFYKLARNKAGDDNSVGFYWHNSDGSAFTYPTGHQAYLAVPQNLVSQTSSFSFDGTNGIRDINADSDSSREIYSITGVRVNNSQLTKGIYIINGKKTIIK